MSLISKTAVITLSASVLLNLCYKVSNDDLKRRLLAQEQRNQILEAYAARASEWARVMKRIFDSHHARGNVFDVDDDVQVDVELYRILRDNKMI